MSESPNTGAPSAGRIAALGPDHADAVWSLYQRVQASAPHGFLAHRVQDDFARILTGQTTGVAVGAFEGGHLHGYSFSRMMAADNPVALAFGFAAGSAFEGMGSAIDQKVSGRLLMSRMLALRGQMERAKGGVHVVGLIDVANLASVAHVLRSGGVLVGLRRDATSLNYVAYGGALVQAKPPISTGPDVLAADLATQRHLFAAGWTATALRRKDNDQTFTFAAFGATLGHIGPKFTEV